MRRLAIGALVFFLGCGDEQCKMPEDVYEVHTQEFIPSMESDLEQITGTFEIKRMDRDEKPSDYWITCNVDPMGSHEFSMFKRYSQNEEWELMFHNRENPLQWATTIRGVEDMSDATQYRCAILGAQQRFSDSIGNSTLVQSADFYGAVESKVRRIPDGHCNDLPKHGSTVAEDMVDSL